MSRRGLNFGVFLAPFHRLGENPTLAMARDLELIDWLDHLGYDEAWIGEHHSAGWETIAAPEIFMAAAAERTRHIRLGSGVTSLPYHNPFMVAQRFVQLDHMTRGRIMLGCGPGALTSDAYMLAIDPVTQRNRMVESLETILSLLKCEEPVTRKTDWFELNNARLHLAPYSDPCFPIAVASTITPFGMMAAGRHGLGVLSIGAGLPGGPEALAGQWKIAEETAEENGTSMNRKDWRVIVVAHIAEDTEQALKEVHKGERRETLSYFADTLGRPPGRSDDPLRDGVKMGTTLVGDPGVAIKGIERLLELSGGGFGGIMFRAHEWANREQTMRSYELFARYVMPHFQGSLDTLYASNTFTKENRIEVVGRNVEAVRRAFTDTGREVPDAYRERTLGILDMDPETSSSKKKCPP
jgi:limonene 1,2-monooxygenase